MQIHAIKPPVNPFFIFIAKGFYHVQFLCKVPKMNYLFWSTPYKFEIPVEDKSGMCLKYNHLKL